MPSGSWLPVGELRHSGVGKARRLHWQPPCHRLGLRVTVPGLLTPCTNQKWIHFPDLNNALCLGPSVAGPPQWCSDRTLQASHQEEQLWGSTILPHGCTS